MLGYKNFNLAGSSWQQGGSFLLEKRGGKVQCLYAQVEENPADFAPVGELMNALHINTYPRFHPSDALAEFLDAASKQRGVDGESGDGSVEGSAPIQECADGSCEFVPRKRK